jgi:hypothetical protein
LLTALKRDLDQYLVCYNADCAKPAVATHGRVPPEIFYGARKMRAAR